MARKRVVAFSLPPDVIKRLEEEADKRGLSKSSFLTFLLKEYFFNSSKNREEEDHKNMYFEGVRKY